jgi:hypothetical protein
MAQDKAFSASLGLLFALALLPALWTTDAAAATCDDPFTTQLVTGTGIDVGEVWVCNDAENLTVTYKTWNPWCVLKINLQVASDLSGIPKTVLGTPNWLRFDIVDRVDCPDEVDPYVISLADIDGGVAPGKSVVIAARAVVDGGSANKKACLFGDTCVAWGAGTRFRPRLPATYFSYTLEEPGPTCPCATFDAATIAAANWEQGKGFCAIASSLPPSGNRYDLTLVDSSNGQFARFNASNGLLGQFSCQVSGTIGGQELSELKTGISSEEAVECQRIIADAAAQLDDRDVLGGNSCPAP